MPFGVVTYEAGAIQDPALNLNSYIPSWRLLSDGSYRSSAFLGQRGLWTQIGNGYRLVSDPGASKIVGLSGDMANINWANPDVHEGLGIELQRQVIESIAVVAQGTDTWEMIRSWQTLEFAVDTSLVIDASKPVRVSSGFDQGFKILAPSRDFVPFTSTEVVGSWLIPGTNQDAIDEAPHCQLGSGFDSKACADIVAFNADGTAITEYSQRSATWNLGTNGHVELTFVDNGGYDFAPRCRRC